MRIELESRGYILIDEEDIGLLHERTWRPTPKGYFNASVKKPVRRTLILHRIIVQRMLGRELSRSELVDHINRNPRDNRRSNLRVATASQNAVNKVYGSTSGYRGVYMPLPRYQARIWTGSSGITIGTYETPEEAAWMFDQWALGIHGEFSILNFEYV